MSQELFGIMIDDRRRAIRYRLSDVKRFIEQNRSDEPESAAPPPA